MLELAGLTRRFGDAVALDGLDLEVRPGELCGFLGANGAGKTTAMRCAVGVTRPDAGTVRWRGREVDLAARRRTGYLPEERGLYPRMRVHEQLVYLARLHARAPEDATRQADAWIERLGLGERRDTPVEELSLGNQQRVQFAAALVHDPELLVLDEPFAGLDPLAVDVMSDVLRERADAGVGVVFSSHQLDLVEDLCRTVAVVSAGRVVLRGEVAALKRGGDRRLRLEVSGGAERRDAPPADVSERAGRSEQRRTVGSGRASWLDELPVGARVAERRGPAVTLTLAPGVDAGAVIATARRAGELTAVRLEEPRLSELFRDALGPAAGP
jgi:ABC-2 type transport system ATP-binding protein